MWSIAAISIGAGLAVGAFFIPVIDEPAVAIPLWTVVGLAIASLDRSPRTAPDRLQTGSAGPAAA